MKEKLNKYAKLLINRCLSVSEGQPLLISAPIDAIEFVRIVTNVAITSGVRDIYYDFTDDELKYYELKYYNESELIESNFFNKKIYDEYAKKNAAFLILCANNTDLINDINEDKITYTSKISRSTRPIFNKKQLTYEVPWCIACVSTLPYAKKVLPNSKDPVNDLWNLIFKMTLIDTEDPIKSWNNKILNNTRLVKKLNELNIKTLKYKNSLGTDFKISFDNNIWCGSNTKSKDGKDLIVNMPTEEIFSSPNKFTANGIVYSSRPLIYNGTLIDKFWLKFDKGKVVDFDAVNGKEILKGILNIENGNYLGEVALVDKNSPIFKSNIIFYETLYDENASCHLALGGGFTECIKENNTTLNKSLIHIDFMIGTSDMNIDAITDNGIVTIMKNGEFVI